MRCIPGLNCRNGRRGLCRSPVDMAEDAQHYAIAKWLRAKGGLSGDGTKTGFHLQDWKDQGWEGESVEFRRWHKDTWAQQAKKWDEWWSGGYEPKEEPASWMNAVDWSDWKATSQGGGKGGGGGGSTGSGHSQPVPAPWHRAKEERASSSGGGGPGPKDRRSYEPKEEPAPKAQPPSSSDRRARSTSRNKIARSPAALSPEPFTP